MQGNHDGFLIASYPDGTSAAAVSVAGVSTPAPCRLQTHEIFDGEAQAKIVAAARKAAGAYKPPTS